LRLFNQRGRLTALILVWILTSLGCSVFTRSAGQGGPAPTAIPDGQSRPNATPALPSQGQPSPLPSSAITPSLSPTGLDALDRYRILFQMSVGGKNDNGEDKTGKLEILQEVDKTAQSEHLNYHAEGVAVRGKVNTFDLYKRQEQVYIVIPEGQPNAICAGFAGNSIDLSAFAPLTPETLVGSTQDNSTLLQKGEVVDGVMADHYQFTAAALAKSGFQNGQGDYWVAQPEGYVLRLTGQASGKNTVFGQVLDGQITWSYWVKPIEEPLAIQAPASCAGQQPAAGLPVPENATGKGGFASITTFRSPDPPRVVADFYRQQLAALGWEKTADEAVDSLVQMQFSKAGKALKVVIVRDNQAGCTVTLDESP